MAAFELSRAPASVANACRQAMLTSGTSTTWLLRDQRLVSTTGPSCGVPEWNLESAGARRPGTLLGPEGSSDRPLGPPPPRTPCLQQASEDRGGGAARILRTTQWTRASL